MSCNWCQDESVALALFKKLCGQEEDDESWKQDSDNDLCYCTPCVREYHRLKNEYVREKPECNKILYRIEVERLKNHFGEFLSQKGHLSRSLSESPYDIEDHLKVPCLELLRYPYLLFSSELMNLFVACLVLLIRNGKFDSLDEKLPGIYLLLVNPSSEVRKWALKTAKELGTISLEDYHCVSPVINCMLKIVLYGLDDIQLELQTCEVPMSAIGDDANPLPHLFHPLPKKDFWLGLGVIFNALDDDVIRILLSQKGHRQVFRILKSILESKDPDSKIAFWPVLFCLKVLMTKFESTFWLLTDFEDAPKTMMDLICNHALYKKEIDSLNSRSFQPMQGTSLDEVTLSQLAEKEEENTEEEDKEEEDDELPSTESQDYKQRLCDPFFWIVPYITTVLDLEELCEKATCDVVRYLYSLVSPYAGSWLDFSLTELNYFVLNCLCDVIRYLLDHKLIFIIKTAPDIWLSIIFDVCFNSSREGPSERWMQVMRKARSILSAILKQAIKLSTDKRLEDYLLLLNPRAPGREFANTTFDNQSVIELEKILPNILQTIWQTAKPGLFGLDIGSSRLVAFSHEDHLQEEKKGGKLIENDCTPVKGKSGTSESPICISDSDDDLEVFGAGHCVEEKGVIEPISYEEDLDYSEESPSETGKLRITEELIFHESQIEKSSGNESAIFQTFQDVKSKTGNSGKSLYECIDLEAKEIKVKSEMSDEATREINEIEEDSCEVHVYNGDVTSGNGEVKGESAKVKGHSGDAEVESKDERYLDAITKLPETIGAPDINRHSILTGNKPNVWFSYSKDREPLLGTDLDMIERNGGFSVDECNDDELITIQSQCKDEDVIEICTSEEIGGTESKKKQVDMQRKIKVKDSSVSQYIGSVEVFPKINCEDSRKTEVDKEQLWQEQNKIYSENRGKEISRKRLSANIPRQKERKRTKLESINNYSSLHKRTPSAINHNTFDSAKVENKSREVDSTKGKTQLELSKQVSRVNNLEKDRDQFRSDAKSQSIKSPLRSRGAFDFIGDLQKSSDANSESDETFVNVNSMLGKEEFENCNDRIKAIGPREEAMGKVIENFVDEVMEEGVIEEARGHSQTFGIHADENREAKRNMESEAFQRNKTIWYNDCVKQQKSRELRNSNTETTVNYVGRSPDKVQPTDQRHPFKENINVNKKAFVGIQNTLPVVKKSKHTRDSLLEYILSWHPFWMENEQQDELSINLPFNPKMVKKKYSSSDDYLDTMWPLILIEFFSQMIRDYKEKERTQLHYKFASFDTVRESKNYLIIHCNSPQENNNNGRIAEPNKCDLVILRCGDENMIEVFGVIEEAEKAALSVEEDPKGTYSFTLSNLTIRVAKLQPGMKFSSMQIEVVTSMVSLFRKWEALIRFPESLLAKDILAPFRPLVFGLANELNTDNAPTILANKYNPGQSNAIAEITNAVLQPYGLPRVRLLQGPPGTGKTHTLTGLVKSILQSKPQNEKFRILVCAASNAAVDEIVLRLINDPPFLDGNNKDVKKNPRSPTNSRHNCGDFSVLRIGSKSQIDARVEKFSFDYLVKKELDKVKRKSPPNTLKSEIHQVSIKIKEIDTDCTKIKMSATDSKSIELKEKMREREQWKKQYDELQKQMKSAGTKNEIKEKEKQLRNLYLTKANIICCTLSGAGNVHMVNTFRTEWNKRNGIPFNCVIIDEAGQCCEPEAMIPLQYGSSKLVLVGDPEQLPATIFSKHALRNGYGQSLFERIQKAYCEPKDGHLVESPVLMLTEQYRMHPAICEFPSQKFYNGKLSTAREVLQRRFHPAIKPMIVLNIKKSQEANEKNGVIHNIEERKYVLHLCDEVVKRGISKPEEIGVITPYKKQLQELRREMSDGNLKKVEVHTVDGFQGREKDIIIISCVRAQSRIGFLQDTQRMNVALTRAKHSLILIMHSDSLQVNIDWKDLIEFARSSQLFFDIASTGEAREAIFGRSVDILHRLGPDSDTADEQTEVDSTISPVSTAVTSESNELDDDDSKSKQKKSNTKINEMDGGNISTSKEKESNSLNEQDRSKGYLLVVEGETSVDIEGQLSPPVSEKDRLLTCQVRDCRREIPEVEVEKRKKCVGAKQNGEEEDASFRKKTAEKKAVCSGTQNIKLPHTHSDGTKCKEKCYKAEAPTAHSGIPDEHGNGKKEVDNGVKKARRSRPSCAYFKLPHIHEDGVRCVDKCNRMEVREKQRWQMERATTVQSSNSKVEGQLNHTGEDSLAKSPPESFVSSNQNAKSCSKDVILEQHNKKQSDPRRNSQSVSQPTDKKTEGGAPIIAERPESQDDLNQKRHHQEKSRVRSANENKNKALHSSSKIENIDTRQKKENPSFVDNNFSPPARPLWSGIEKEGNGCEKNRKKEHTNIIDQTNEEHNKSVAKESYTSNSVPEINVQRDIEARRFRNDRISGNRRKCGHLPIEETDSINPERRKLISATRSKSGRNVQNSKGRNGSSPSAIKNSQSVKAMNGRDSTKHSLGRHKNVKENAHRRRIRPTGETSYRNGVIPHEAMYDTDSIDHSPERLRTFEENAYCRRGSPNGEASYMDGVISNEGIYYTDSINHSLERHRNVEENPHWKGGSPNGEVSYINDVISHESIYYKDSSSYILERRRTVEENVQWKRVSSNDKTSYGDSYKGRRRNVEEDAHWRRSSTNDEASYRDGVIPQKTIYDTDSSNHSPGRRRTVDEDAQWRRSPTHRTSYRNDIIPQEEEPFRRIHAENELRGTVSLGNKRHYSQQNAYERSFDINANNNIDGFVSEDSSQLKRSSYSNERSEFSRKSELSRSTADRNIHHNADFRQENERNLEAVTQRIRANEQGRYRQTQMLDSPESIHVRRPRKSTYRRYSFPSRR